MPTYAYICTDCGASTEVRATVAEKDEGLRPNCPACQGDALRRAFTPIASVGGSRAVPTAAAPAGGGCCAGGCVCGN